MDDKSETASTLAWLWVIEALAGCKEIDTSTLQDLIDVSPVEPNDFDKNTRELVALRCLEGLFGSASGNNFDASSSQFSRVGLDFSRSCEDVLQEILHEIPLSNLKMAGAEHLKWDICPFIRHKRASARKCKLEQLKESLVEGTHPHIDLLKERSGLALWNGDCQVPLNDGKCNDLLAKHNGNCTYAENMGAKENSVSLNLENGNKSSKEHFLDKKFSPSKRNRVDSADEHVMGDLHEKQVGINECDDFLRNAKKIKFAPSNIESNKYMPVFQHGRDMSENSTERVPLIFERERHHTEKDHMTTLGESSALEDCHNRCSASNWCRSSSHNEVGPDLSDLPLNATMRPEHTSGGEPCQQQFESIPMNVALLDEIQHKISAGEPWSTHESCLQLKDPNGFQKTVAVEKAGDDAGNGCRAEISGDCNMYQDQTNNLLIKKHEVLIPRCTSGHDSSAHAKSSDSDGNHNERVDFVTKKHEFLSSQYISSHDSSANTERREQNLCMKCNRGGQLLVCNTTTCSIKVHESCLGTSARFDAKGNFLCPFCAYSHTISEYLEAKEKASLARKELAIFIGTGTGHQATELLQEIHGKEKSLSINSKCELIRVKDNRNDHLPRTGREDNREDHVIEHVNEVNNLHFERSQQQAEPPTSCDNILPSCREKGIVNNGIEKVLSGEERGGLMNLKSSTVRGLDENRVPADHVVSVGDKKFHHEANVLSVNHNNKGEEIQQEMLEQHNTDRSEDPVCAHGNEEEKISEDKYIRPIVSRHSMRPRKCEPQYKPKAILQIRRKKIPWAAEEEEMLREGVQKFGESDQKFPWKEILKFGSHVFLKERRPMDLKDKWKNICKASSKSK